MPYSDKDVSSFSLTSCKYFMLFAPLHKITKLLSAAMDLEMIYLHKKYIFQNISCINRLTVFMFFVISLNFILLLVYHFHINIHKHFESHFKIFAKLTSIINNPFKHLLNYSKTFSVIREKW